MLTKKERETIYNRKRQKVDKKTLKITPGFVNTTLEDFEVWFDEEVFNKGCNYCGLTNVESRILFDLQIEGFRPNATRGGKRGRRLELDRKNPILPYDDLNNVVWCCYWCNNAKSNFFTEAEFKPIALVIGKALFDIIQVAKRARV
ncbi:hypothetical protein [Rufibacter psychrotolerans]|uniref:hypothetical protein n=1 Tax=Rufibacter psychrotolerans TaxID=2812556 RepID=UPI0019670DF0|nr:hypothetical protein [Rufibacter sp. SYSU D00308]